MRKLLLLSTAALCVVATPLVSANAADAAKSTDLVKPVEPHYGQWGIDLSAGDHQVKPGNDFDAYVNGAWEARTPIPADQKSASVTYDVYNLTLKQNAYVIASQGPDTQIGGVYASFMNTAQVEKVGDASLRAELAKVAAIADKAGFAGYMGKTMGAFGSSVVGLSVDAGLADPTKNVLWVSQAGLGLPDRDYYLKDSFAPQRKAYVAYIARQLALAGYPHAGKAAPAIMAFETAIAKVSWSQAKRRDIDNINNPMTLAQFAVYAPGIDWSALLAGAGIADPGTMVVQENSAIKAIADVFAKTPLATLKAWEAFHLVSQASPYLPKRYVDSRFEFTRALYGTKALPPRWKRANSLLDTALGELLGQKYIADFFPAKSKAMMEDLVANLKVAMARRIVDNSWMAPATKMAALEKLAKMKVMVGYPDKFRDYSGLKVEAADLFGNVERSNAFEWHYQRSKLGEAVDRARWAMNPQTVNAYNGFNENKIVFPAGILQPPFFDPTADMAANYGAIGAVIGHEISHGFDDQGRKIDADGKLHDWWSAADAKRFEAEAASFGKQYDSYEPVPGMHVNGEQTMGENIADLAGMTVALDAYHASLKGHPAPVIDGITGDQRFFMSWAQIWRNKERPDAVKAQLASDPHTPAKFRIIGPTRNIDAWYKAFDVQPGSTYYLAPKARVHIW